MMGDTEKEIATAEILGGPLDGVEMKVPHASSRMNSDVTHEGKRYHLQMMTFAQNGDRPARTILVAIFCTGQA